MSRTSRALPVILVASLLSLVSISPAAAASSTTYETQVVHRTNTKRIDHDRVEVSPRPCVDSYAEKQARWMAKHRKLVHQDLRTILNKCGLTGVSENIAYGYSSGNRVVTAWMKSKGHRANLLAKKMRYIGVGAVKDEDGTWWVSQVFGTKK